MKNIFFVSVLFIGSFVFSQDEGKCIVGDCENGEGTWVWDDGDKFEGFWKDGLYIDGVFFYKNAGEYEGKFKDGMRHGIGTMSWANGSQYSGDWNNDQENGNGIWFSGDSEDRYEGEFKESKFNGQGTYFWSDGSKYEGAWSNGNMDGLGVMTEKEYIDKGTWNNDVRHGLIERYTLNNVKVYEIEYLDGDINGYIRVYNKNGNVITEDIVTPELETANKVLANGELTMCSIGSDAFYYYPSYDEKSYLKDINIGPWDLDNIFITEFCYERVYVDSKEPVNGLVYEIYTNGNKKYQMRYKNGKYDKKYFNYSKFNSENYFQIKGNKRVVKIISKF